MTRMAVIAGLAIGLIGCSGEQQEEKAAAAAAPAEAAAAIAAFKPEPGLYRATITMTGIEVPGMPAEMAGHGAGMTTTTEDCLTREEAGKGVEELLKQGQNGECRYESFAFARNAEGGTYDAVMVCQSGQGAARMEMTGATTPKGAEFIASTRMNFDGVGEATMTFTGTHERIGDCPAK
jgi:hypothetical protein